MDYIHKTEHRPTVALVLSGGGAKGSAHVGVLRKLEEMKIPIDMICGTSMGGLVGGLYAMGYPSSYLDSLLRNQDWDFMLTDKVDPEYIPYTTKEYKSRYLLSIPFHYDKKTAIRRMRDYEKYSSWSGKLQIDADAGDFGTQSGVSNLASSLPSGYVYGFNVNNLISSLTVGYQDSISFSKLPIPYYSVAADIVSCKAKNWGSGSVKDAMRSTMSIPGMFDPVRTHGLVLVDGGVRNNFPVDIARAMGADYVIGVDLSGEDQDYGQINNLGNMLMQFIKMLGKDAFDKNTPEVDVYIKPDLKGYNMLSFNPVAIDTMIHRGYAAATGHADELQVIKDHMPDAELKLQNWRATDLSTDKVLLSAIIFDGIEDNESRLMMRKIGLNVGTFVGRDEIEDAMSKLQATGRFETVTYSLLGETNPYRLVFNCNKAPAHRVGAGFRVDSHEWASLLLNVGLNTNKLKGAKLDLEGRIGLHRYIDLKYSLDLPFIPTFNVEAKYSGTYGELSNGNGLTNYNLEFKGHKEMAYFSNIRWTRADIQIGAKNQCYHPTRFMTDSQIDISSQYPEDYLTGDFLSGFFNSKIYTKDDKYFPTKGIYFKAEAEWVFRRLNDTEGNFSAIPIASLDYEQVVPLGGSTAFIFDLHTRDIFNSNAAFCFANITGGSFYGHYIDQQIPFAGFHETYLAENYLALANVNLRFNPAKNFYISAVGGALQQADRLDEMITRIDKIMFGGGIQAAYNTIIGPVKADVTWSNLTRRVGFFISAGFDF